MPAYCPAIFGRNAIRAAEAPPPLSPDLRDEELVRLVHAHTDLDEPTQSRRYARALANAELADVENGRLLILHVVREIGIRIATPVRAIETAGDPFEVVRRTMLVIADDADLLASAAAAGPRRGEAAQMLVSALDVLAEARAVAAILTDAFPSDAVASSVHEEATVRLSTVRAAAVSIGAVSDADDADLMEWARDRLVRQSCHDLEPAGPGELRRVERLAGNWFLLMSAMPKAGMRREAGRGLVQPLSTRDALNLRRAAAAAAAAFGALRDVPGFFSLLSHLSMGDRYRHAAATGSTVFQGSPLANLIHHVRNTLRPASTTLPILTLRREPGGIAGRFDDGTMGIAILEDHPARLSARYPDAVRVVPMAHDRIELPTLEEARAIGVGLSFRTLEDALACIESGDPETAQLFFAGEYVVCDLLDAPAQEITVEAAAPTP